MKMHRYTFLIILILFLYSCYESGEINKSDILSNGEFYSLLIDLHKAEGIISTSNIRMYKSKKDSISLYNFVLKKNNVSRQKFNNTVKYYSYHTDEYLVFYDSLYTYFKKLDQDLKDEVAEKLEIKRKEELEKKDTANLWLKKDIWKLPEDGASNPIPFKIKTKKHGQYILQADIKLYKDDKSVNQRMTLIANYTDGSKDLNSAGTMVKDGNFEHYYVSLITNTKKTLSSISGWILDHSKNTGKKHAHVKNIQINYNEISEKENKKN